MNRLYYAAQREKSPAPESRKADEPKPAPAVEKKEDLVRTTTQEVRIRKEEFWEQEGYKRYLDAHGSHFSNRMAEWASAQLQNAFGDPEHRWSADDVRQAFEKMGFIKPKKNTWGDATYLANNTYAVSYSISLRTEGDIIKQTYAELSDPNGYPEKIFNRYLADVMSKGTQVPWDDLIDEGA